jgi:predicted MFS family arabinose efflux permease
VRVLRREVVDGHRQAARRLTGVVLLDLLAGGGLGLLDPGAGQVGVVLEGRIERNTAMGVYQATWAAGIVLGAPLAGSLADSHGLTAAFLTAALAAALAAGLTLRLHGD